MKPSLSSPQQPGLLCQTRQFGMVAKQPGTAIVCVRKAVAVEVAAKWAGAPALEALRTCESVDESGEVLVIGW